MKGQGNAALVSISPEDYNFYDVWPFVVLTVKVRKLAYNYEEDVEYYSSEGGF